MTESNSFGNRPRGSFGDTVAADLLAGRAVDLAELFALHALDVVDEAALERYLESAPTAEREEFERRVREARETLTMSFIVEEEPPADLFSRILSQLPAAETVSPPGLHSVPTGAHPRADAGQSAVGEPGTKPSQPLDDLSVARERRNERRRITGPRRWMAGVAAAAVIALGGVGIGAYVADQNDPLNQVVRADDVQESSVDVSGGGRATVLVSASEDSLVVRMDNVSAPPAGMVYQMWLIPKDGSAPVSQGLMDAKALTQPAVVRNIHTAAALGITVEPEGGSTAPTLPTIAAAPLGTA
ncbi:anti-sigma factor [Pseudarthrobacter sp. PS3-L1]|uniref:anti-sigma factor n=1 Tax=Pseudarthrobacter sp. PS3-L1 TaxID=3046207 RepID=UPI0024BB200E|nr:anti-sigma factor [Pseudarthrobacter sp. PS3-L1]MDJ0321465.1 anti-sigma factor [Pseudarthrobacter sp. PS3-L1]